MSVCSSKPGSNCREQADVVPMLIRFDEARSLTFVLVFPCLQALALASFRLNELGFSSPVSPLISLRAEATISIIVLISVMRNAGLNRIQLPLFSHIR